MSAVIPVYNGEAFVADAIRSVLAQTYQPVECIVVDDGSDDGTEEVVLRFGDAVRLVQKSNGGVASARNAGAVAARGEFVAFLDADDTWREDKLVLQMEAIRREPGLGLVYSGVLVVDRDLGPVTELGPAPGELALRNTLLLEQPSATGIGSTGVLPLSVFWEVGGFDERLSTSADCDLTCRVACRYPVGCVPQPLARYRRHTAQMSADLAAFEHDMALIIEKLFSSGDLPRELAPLRRRACANLHYLLAAGYRSERDRARFVRHLARAFAHDPARSLGLTLAALGARATPRRTRCR